MPLREGGYEKMEELSLPARLDEDKHFQSHWYRHVGTLAWGLSVLDAGAGVGYGLDILRARGAVGVRGFDLLPAGTGVEKATINDYASESFDWVLAIDVIEHVLEDVAFYGELLRVARRAIFISTPNWNVSRAKNRFHVREYAPAELRALIGLRTHQLWMSDVRCVVHPRPRELEDDEKCDNFGVLISK